MKKLFVILILLLLIGCKDESEKKHLQPLGSSSPNFEKSEPKKSASYEQEELEKRGISSEMNTRELRESLNSRKAPKVIDWSVD